MSGVPIPVLAGPMVAGRVAPGALVITSTTPLWYLTRATGLVALVLLTLNMACGLLTSVRYQRPAWPRFVTIGLHRNVALLALAFTGLLVRVLRRSNFRRDSGWVSAVGKVGVPGLHFHDLRHTGNTLAAPGASLADLKARMGHDSARAAVIYQHATAAADRAIADGLDRQIEASAQG